MNSYHSKIYRKSYRRRRGTYVPQQSRMPSVSRPYASKYDDTAYIKVQRIVPIDLEGEQASHIYFMRQDSFSNYENSYTVVSVPEYQAFAPLFAFYEVLAMKAEVTIEATSDITSANMYAGMFPFLELSPLPETDIPNSVLVKAPIQTVCNVQGQVSTIYYDFSADLKKQGAQFSVATGEVYSQTQNGVIVFKAGTSPNVQFAYNVGYIKFTWFVRFSSRHKRIVSAPNAVFDV